MSINTKELSEQVRNDLMDRFNISTPSELSDRLQYDSARSIFTEWLEYQGIIGYADAIIDAWENINSAVHSGHIEAHH